MPLVNVDAPVGALVGVVMIINLLNPHQIEITQSVAVDPRPEGFIVTRGRVTKTHSIEDGIVLGRRIVRPRYGRSRLKTSVVVVVIFGFHEAEAGRIGGTGN